MKILAVLVALFLVGNAMAASEEEVTTATVTVNEFLSITISDPAESIEVAFGNLNPGTNDSPDLEQSTGITTPAITVTNDAVSNVNVNIDVKGTEFSDGSNTIAINQVTYDDDGNPSQGTETGKAETTMSTTYPGTSYYTAITPGSSAGFWFFLDVPSGQEASTGYQSTFTFRGTT